MFRIDFVGVVCLFRDGDAEHALLPDGRRSKPAHVARLIVDPQRIVAGAETWGTRDPDDIERGEFTLPPGALTIEGANQAGQEPVRSETLDERLPRLTDLARDFVLDPDSPNIWTSVAIRQGTLEAFRWPGSRDSPTVSVLAQLTVPHQGPFRITVMNRRTRDQNAFLQLQAETNVVIVNDSTADTSRNPHFHIYNLLDRDGRMLLSKFPPNTRPNVPPLVTSHHFYNRPSSGDDLCPVTRP